MQNGETEQDVGLFLLFSSFFFKIQKRYSVAWSRAPSTWMV